MKNNNNKELLVMSYELYHLQFSLNSFNM